jgi:hypothetical protein
VPDIFFPQLALFLASRPLLALYREFVFPSVPSRTGLLPLALDDIRTVNPENMPIAVDIALWRAAVVVYDSGQRGRIPLDFVRRRRENQLVIVVEAPSEQTIPNRPDLISAGEAPVARPVEMSGWPTTFVEPLLSRLATRSRQPSSEEIAKRLSMLRQSRAWGDLVLTGLALLERKMRVEELATAVPLNVSGGTMERLQSYFGDDFGEVIDAVGLRHDLLQDQKPDIANLERIGNKIADLATRFYELSQ